jgi:multicomponent Na+:H+ antiporter subunit F
MTLEAVVTILILPLLGAGLLITFIRIIRGPSLPDRVVALDLMATFIIAISAVYSVASNEPSYLDAAVVLALITFLGTVAFAYYLSRRGGNA